MAGWAVVRRDQVLALLLTLTLQMAHTLTLPVAVPHLVPHDTVTTHWAAAVQKLPSLREQAAIQQEWVDYREQVSAARCRESHAFAGV